MRLNAIFNNPENQMHVPNYLLPTTFDTTLCSEKIKVTSNWLLETVTIASIFLAAFLKPPSPFLRLAALARVPKRRYYPT